MLGLVLSLDMYIFSRTEVSDWVRVKVKVKVTVMVRVRVRVRIRVRVRLRIRLGGGGGVVGSVLVATPGSVHSTCIELQLLITPQHHIHIPPRPLLFRRYRPTKK